MNDESELREILHDQVGRLFADHATKEVLEAAEAGTWPEALWQTIEEAGLTRLLVSERGGGSDGSWRDAQVIMRLAGRYQVPVPLIETMLASCFMDESGMEIPDGPIAIAPVRREDQRSLDFSDILQVNGKARRVPWGGRVGHVLIVPATGLGATEGVTDLRSEDARGRFIRLFAKGNFAVAEDWNIAREPRDTLTFVDASQTTHGFMPEEVTAETLWRYGAMARSAQMAGALESLLEQTVHYANDRTQFGRPIGKFQAIQQQLAAMASEVAAAGAAVEAAFEAADRGNPWFEIACAKVRSGEAAGTAAAIAHQVHGAIGFTYEHRLHFATRRLWSWRAEFGSEAVWAEEIGRHVAGRGADALWPMVTGER